MTNLTDAITNAVSDTLENLAFMEVMPVPDAGDTPREEALLAAALLIYEPYRGEIRLELPRPLLEEIFQTVFGLLEEETGPDLNDLLAELLNTIAGRMLIELLPANQPFQFGLPVLNPAADCAMDTWTRWHFCTDSHQFTVCVSELVASDGPHNEPEPADSDDPQKGDEPWENEC